MGKPATSHKFEFSLADKQGNNRVKVKALAVDDVGAPVSAPSAWPHLDRSNSQVVTQEECKLKMSESDGILN